MIASRLIPFLLVILMLATPMKAAVANAITLENEKPGTRDWLLTKVDTVLNEKNPLGENSPHFERTGKIEAFASRTSYASGETVTLFVSTDPASEFAVDVYRLGFYQGKGGRHMLSAGPLAGKAQSTPEDGDRNLRECTWEKSHEFVVPQDWLSGVYLAKLTRTGDGFQAYAIFVVKDDAGRTSISRFPT